MNSEELLAYYQQQTDLIPKIYQPTNEKEFSRYLIYIVDTQQGQNYPLFAPLPADSTFSSASELQKLFGTFFKQAPTQTDKNEKITNIFQIHLILASEKENFIAIAENTKAQGFFNKLAGKTSTQIWMFWGNLKENKLNVIFEEDQRFRKLIIRNYYREAEEIFYTKSEYKKVELILAKCLELAPDDPESLILMGRCKLFMSNFEAAEDIFNKATTVAQNNERAWYGLATAQAEIFKINPYKEHIAYLDAAERNADKGLRINPQNIELLNLKSGIALLKQDAPKAITLLRQALQIKPADLNSRRNLALALLATAQLTEALMILEEVMVETPQDENVAHRIIQCLFELKQTEQAIQKMNEWRPKARLPAWIESLEATYLVEIPEEFLNENNEG